MRLATEALHENLLDIEATGAARADSAPVGMIAIAAGPQVTSSRSSPRRQPVPLEITAGLRVQWRGRAGAQFLLVGPRVSRSYFARKSSTAAFHSSGLVVITPCGAPWMTTSSLPGMAMCVRAPDPSNGTIPSPSP